MFPLSTDAIPATAADWREALADTLTRWVAGETRVSVEGDPPAVRSVEIDLSGGRLGDAPPPDVARVGPAEPGPTVGRFHAAATRFVVRQVPFSFDVSADEARFDLGRNAAGRIVVTLANATSGRLTAHLAAADVDAALLVAARAGAAPHGVDVRSVHATFTPHGPRDLGIVIDLTAKKFVTFPLRVGGRVTVDDAMVLTATGLTVEGTGMAAGFAAGVIRPQLAKVDGRPIPLGTALPVPLRDVAVDVADGVRLTATFGDATSPV